MAASHRPWKRFLSPRQDPASVNPLAELFPNIGEPDNATATRFRRSYAILFMPRSGSTMLARTLLVSGVFGDPDEWFNGEPGSVAADYVAEGRGDTFYSYVSHIQ